MNDGLRLWDKIESEIHHAEDNEFYIPDLWGPGQHALAVPVRYLIAAREGWLRSEQKHELNLETLGDSSP